MSKEATLPKSNKRQHVRTHIAQLAAVGSFVVISLVIFASVLGYVDSRAARIFSIAVGCLVVIFYSLIISGISQRFSDRFFAIVQLLAAGLAISYVVYEEAEPLLFLWALYFTSYLFGVATLDTIPLIAVGLCYVLFYVGALSLSWIVRPGTLDVLRQGIQLAMFSILVGWFTLCGAYITRVRTERRRARHLLKTALEESEILASIDSLTGCYNRRYGFEQFEVECKRAKRGGTVSICIADIDNFKSINDAFGHAAGDQVLKEVAAILSGTLRATDFVTRYGGEEFLLVFSETPIAAAALIAERLRHLVENHSFTTLPRGRQVTISMGVAEYRPDEDPDGMFLLADRALYQAKDEGRNRVCQDISHSNIKVEAGVLA